MLYGLPDAYILQDIIHRGVWCMVGFWHWHIPTFIITDISPHWWDFVMVVLCWVPMMMMMMMITLVLIRILGRTPHLIHPARTPSPTLHLYSTVHQNQETRICFPIWWWCTQYVYFSLKPSLYCTAAKLQNVHQTVCHQMHQVAPARRTQNCAKFKALSNAAAAILSHFRMILHEILTTSSPSTNQPNCHIQNRKKFCKRNRETIQKKN